ncbi:MAG: putative sulfate exporter family transporter [Microbacteriaceae bacterium]|nr:putative sulfate exporter family transporter [Microbacteriaceae bacterium]
MLVSAVPLLTAAVVLGIIVGQLPILRGALDGTLRGGLQLSSKSLMRAGIVLLGLKLSLSDVADLGWVAIVSIVGLVVVTFFGTWGFGQLLRLPGRQSLLLAAGFSICGASAVGAMSAATRSKDEEQATPVALVTLCGTLAIAVLPALRLPLGLNSIEFGRWVGASVHDVGQVVATAQTAGSAALAVAVVVKLTRVLMLAPMVSTAAVILRRSEWRAARAESQRAGDAAADAATELAAAAEQASANSVPAAKKIPIVPLFIIGFIAAVLINSFLRPPLVALQVADLAQTIVLAAALFALGTSVRIRSLLTTGWRALVVGLASWLLVAVLGLLLIQL